MVDALTWLLTLELLGVIALPLCFVLFRRLPDRGITLAKPLALAALAYLLWLAGLTRLIPNTQGTIIAIAAAAAVVSALAFRGLVRKVRLQSDQRVVRVELTKEGEALVPELRRRVDDFYTNVIGDLSQEEFSACMTTLGKLTEGVSVSLARFREEG